VGSAKATTLSLTVVVLIEMLNSFNALSENASLLTVPPWANPWLSVATAASVALHCLLLYTPFLADLFRVTPLSLAEWGLVFAFSAPVILVDECLKAMARFAARRGGGGQ